MRPHDRRPRVAHRLARLVALIALVSFVVGAHAAATSPFVPANVSGRSPSAASDARMPPHAFVFPRDDGAHEAYRSEIWRAFGFLRTADDRRIDVTATFFRYAEHANPQRSSASAWSRAEFFPATFALADRPAFHVVSRARFERAGVGLAHAAVDHLDVAAGTWSLRGTRAAAWAKRRFALRAARDGAALDLALTPQREPIALGPGGVERIGSCSACVAYGYAYTRLGARGNVEIDGVRYAVSGSMWLDHEYGNGRSDPNDTGATRIAIQFEDGRDLLITTPHAADRRWHPVGATLVRANGRIIRYDGADLVVEPRAAWTSEATGAQYPSAAFVGIPAEGLAVGVSIGPRESEIVEPMGVASYYDAGADIGRLDPPDGDHGRAYVESTRF